MIALFRKRKPQVLRGFLSLSGNPSSLQILSPDLFGASFLPRPEPARGAGNAARPGALQAAGTGIMPSRVPLIDFDVTGPAASSVPPACCLPPRRQGRSMASLGHVQSETSVYRQREDQCAPT